MSAPRPPRDNPLAGIRYALAGIKLITAPGLRTYVAVPLLINVVLFAGGLYWAWSQLGVWRTAVEEWLPDWLDLLAVLLVPLFFLAALVVVFFCFALLANLIAAPFNGLLSGAVERHLAAARGETIEQPPFSWASLLREVGTSVGSELRKLGYFAPRALLLLLLYLIPGINVFAPFLWLLFSAWMLALGYLDYPMANHGLGFSRQRPLVRAWRLTSLGFGATVTLGVLVPFLNLIVMPAAVAGATLMWSERLSRSAAQQSTG